MRHGLALLGGTLEPQGRFGVVRGNAPSFGVHDAQAVLSGRIAGLRERPPKLDRLEVILFLVGRRAVLERARSCAGGKKGDDEEGDDGARGDRGHRALAANGGRARW